MKVALIGNPNCGKSSLFNHLTGLRQKIGNFPGVTVDKKVGTAKSTQFTDFSVMDLPGTYSLYPSSLDEKVVSQVVTDRQHPDFPDVIVVVVDASNLKRNLFLLDQLASLDLPLVLALNMLDTAFEKGIEINSIALSRQLGMQVVEINAREGVGTTRLIEAIFKAKSPSVSYAWSHPKKDFDTYTAWQQAVQQGTVPQKEVDEVQRQETMERYQRISGRLEGVLRRSSSGNPAQIRWDSLFLHPVGGYVSFLLILFLIFQSVFILASYPMDLIDAGMVGLTDYLRSIFPDTAWASMVLDGLLAGVGGIVIFIPQIALLFFFIALLEESGYMARVVVLMDRLIRPFGLNGKSIIPLISGFACAVPAIMSARTIGSWKDRLITILVTPLMSCSARLPIFTILIALVIPDQPIFGFFNLQGVVLLGLYLLGVISALLIGWILKTLIQVKERNVFAMELPTYQLPRWSQVGFTILEKVKTFVFEAGKVILTISVILWILATYGPGDRQDQEVQKQAINWTNLSETEQASMEASVRLEYSYAGIIGKWMEPAIRPLGYDWKMGIALITSFAAREVFVGTLATIYAIGDGAEAESATIKERLIKEKRTDTGEPIFTLATSLSLMIFYVYAMMCMSTIAVVYRETKGWKWPLIQTGYMMFLAYGLAWITYLLLS